MSRIHLREAGSLAKTNLSWLEIHDHFIATVGKHAGRGRRLGPLVVLADATFAPRSRFPLHPHRDMEILTVVVEGEVSHHGDQANGNAVPARAVQLISARNGIVHAEGNDLDEATRMLQIWFEPNERGGEPEYFERALPEGPGRHVVVGGEGMPIRADATVEWIDLAPGQSSTLHVSVGRAGYLLGLQGEASCGPARLAPRDGAELSPGESTWASKEGASSSGSTWASKRRT